jgi:ribosomal protein S18 acetylase RimI-like enzyme
VYDVCVRTAAGGGDARGLYLDDRLVGDVYAAPYVVLEPEHAFVLDDGTGTVVGYIVGTADTARFVARYRSEWLPRTADRYPEPPERPVTPDDGMLIAHHHPERMLTPEIDDYPAHLHIDILGPWQGQGWGRRLMERFLESLRAGGVPAVHLNVAAGNASARAFYDRLGFVQLRAEAGSVFMGKRV